MRFAGNAIVDVKLETTVPNQNLVALLYDVDGDEGKLITRGAYLIEQGGRVTFELYPQDWILRKGHRFGILLSSNDSSWFNPIPTGAPVTIKGGKLELPFLRWLRTPNLDGKPAEAQSGVPQVSLDKKTIKNRTAAADFPAPMRRR